MARVEPASGQDTYYATLLGKRCDIEKRILFIYNFIKRKNGELALRRRFKPRMGQRGVAATKGTTDYAGAHGCFDTKTTAGLAHAKPRR